MKEVISSIISFFCTIIIVGVDNMESEFTDKALSKCARKVSDLFMNNMDTVLDILGGEDNE